MVIERALIEIFSDDLIRKSLAFRGGTALHKLYLKPQARYSEDIDLVQVSDGPIKPLLERIREKLKFLGTRRAVKENVNKNTIAYRFESEIPPVIKLRLKIEINCREHFSVLGLKEFQHTMNSSWFSGECTIMTYELEELLGTKLRALYQRRKGRDLFDLYQALNHHQLDYGKLIQCYQEYIQFVVDKPPTQKQFVLNMAQKIKDKEFNADIMALLRPGIKYNNEKAYEIVKIALIEKLK